MLDKHKPIITCKLKFDTDTEALEFLKSKVVQQNFDWKYYSKHIEGDEDFIMNILYSFKDNIDYKELSSNTSIKWTENLVLFLSDKLDWFRLSVNPKMCFTFHLLTSFKDKWFWGNDYGSYKYNYYNRNSLSSNPNFPLDVFIVERFREQIDWRGLGLNPSLKIQAPHPYNSLQDEECFERSLHILKQFKSFWRYERSEYSDANIGFSGYEKTSIFDNSNIDWRLPEIRQFFSEEIECFNDKYNEDI